MGMAGVRLEVKVHIVTGAVTSAQNIVRSCHKSGLDVSDIVLESLASAKAVLTEEEREIGVALIDLGGGTCDIAIFANDSIKHTGVLALGGQNLTNDIAFGLRSAADGCGGQRSRSSMVRPLPKWCAPMSISKCPAWAGGNLAACRVRCWRKSVNPAWRKSSRSSIRSWCVPVSKT